MAKMHININIKSSKILEYGNLKVYVQGSLCTVFYNFACDTQIFSFSIEAIFKNYHRDERREEIYQHIYNGLGREVYEKEILKKPNPGKLADFIINEYIRNMTI